MARTRFVPHGTEGGSSYCPSRTLTPIVPAQPSATAPAASLAAPIVLDGADSPTITLPPIPTEGVPTLMHQKYTDLMAGYNVRTPMDCSPDDADDSDEDVSAPTIEFLAVRGATEALLCPLRGIENAIPHRKRRFMYGNERSTLLMNHMNSGCFASILRWYGRCSGEPMPNWRKCSLQSPSIPPSPLIESASLYDVTGVYVFCPATEVSSATLRFLRAPVDYSHQGHTSALYGLTNPASAITRYNDWSVREVWPWWE